jgi:hypothetical protein
MGKVTSPTLQLQWVKRSKNGKNAATPNLCANDVEGICEGHEPKPRFWATADVRQASRIIYPSVLSGEPLGIKQTVGALSR